MKAGDIVVLRMRTSSFAGTQMIGKLVSKSSSLISISDTVLCHEIIQSDGKGNVALRPSYFVSPVHTDGVWEIDRDAEVAGIRLVAETDKIFSMYEEAITRWRLEKSGLVTPMKSADDLGIDKQQEAGL